jgi:hypothetical protein
MNPISENTYENWTLPSSPPASFNTPSHEENFSTRDYLAAKPAIPRTSKQIVCSQRIKSIFERVLLTVTDFFSCSGTIVTKRFAIEQDLYQMLQSPYKMRLADWDHVFNNRCADAIWYGVDVDSVIYQAFLSMDSRAATALKSVCEERDSLDWLKLSIEGRAKAHGDAAKQLAVFLNSDTTITDNKSEEIAKIFEVAVAAGCNIHSIVDSLIAVDSLHAFRLVIIASKPCGAYSSLFEEVNKAICTKLLSDNKIFEDLLAKVSMGDIDKIFSLLSPYLSGELSEKSKIIHLTWAAKNRLKELDLPGVSNGDYAKFERFVHSRGCKPDEVRRIFAQAAGKHIKASNCSANQSFSSPSTYDKWLIDAKHASALSDDKLVDAFEYDNGLYDLPTKKPGISTEDMAVLKAEAGCRAESSEADFIVTLKAAAESSISLDSVWYLLPSVLVAEKHSTRMEKFQKLSFFMPKEDWSSVVGNMTPSERQRIIQSLNYLVRKLKDYGKVDTAKFLAALLPKLGNLKTREMPKKNDRTMISGMLARHLSKDPGRRSDFKFEKFSPSELESFERGLASSFKEIPKLSKNSSADINTLFCEQFEIDNRGFHIWIESEPMDGFSNRTCQERSEMIVHALISDLEVSKEQAMTVSRLCTQDISNQISLMMTEKRMFLMESADEESLGLTAPFGECALTPMKLSMEQIVSKDADGTVTVKYFLFKDNLAEMRVAPDAILLDPEKSEFYGELMFSVQANGEFNIEGDVILGLKKIIVGISEQAKLSA